jgi:5-methylthioadenosine/S-adenosylhomocysteine deaminase
MTTNRTDQPVTTRYRADAVVPCDGGVALFRPGVVDVVGDTIVHVGPDPRPAMGDTGAPGASEVAGDSGGGGAQPEIREVIVDGALLPGLVNVHCHSPMTLFRASGENLPLHRWLHEVLWPREAHLTPEDVYWGMTLAAAELLRFGVTTTCEQYFFEDAVTDAVVAAGSRALVTAGVLQLPGAETHDGWWSTRIQEILDFHGRRDGEAGRIEVGFAPHAAYTVPLPVLADVAHEARALDALFHMHLAETEEECQRFAAEHGKSTPRALADAGVFGGRVLAAHSIWLSEEDRDIYQEFDVAVAHCPQSNAKLASGVAPLADLLARGIRVGLGTDGPASNNDLDLWEEIRLSAMLARLRERDAGTLPASAALDLATRGAGAALGRPDLGVLAVGAKADMMAVNLDDPAFVPWVEESDLIEHLVWSASSRLVTDVWVGGAQVVDSGTCMTIDIDAARSEVEARALRLRRVVD